MAAAFWTLLAAGAWAQSPPTGEASPYLLQVVDVIRILVIQVGAADAAPVLPPVRVGPDGFIQAPLLGSYRAAGRTTAELVADLKPAYEEALRVKNLLVSVTLEAARPKRASVIGAVQRPGPVEIRDGDSVKDLLAAASGLQPNGAADARGAFLRRRGTLELIPLDLTSSTNPLLNLKIQDGDILEVPETGTNNRILVMGRVQKPGPQPYLIGIRKMSLLDAFSSAGEIRGETKSSAIVVFRPQPGVEGSYQQIKCNLAAFWGGDFRQNVPLEPGDIVFVPDTGRPDLAQINSFASVLFLFERLGLNVFRF
jgi:polysaccharide export outer membrane protein